MYIFERLGLDKARVWHNSPWGGVILAPLGFGILALLLGQDANWDLRNYHYYNPYAFLNGRMGYDIVPAQLQSFYNPLLDLPFFFLVNALPPKGVGFILGTLQGVNFILLVGIARQVLRLAVSRWKWLASLILAGLGMLGAGNLSELGTVFYDNVVSLPVLGSLLLVLVKYPRLCSGPLEVALAWAAIAGLLAGLGAGLKLPAWVFAVGLCAAFFILPTRGARRFWLAFLFGLGVVGGVAATSGLWMWTLWERFGNPLFPYFNDLFQGEMGALEDYRDKRFIPQGLVESLFFPLVFAINPLETNELKFRDLRLPLFYLLLLGWLGYALYRRLSHQGSNASAATHFMDRPKTAFLLVSGLLAYAVWLKLFGIYRYLVPLEMLAPLCITAVIDRFPLPSRARGSMVVGAVILLLITFRPFNWGRIPWGEDYFGVQPPPLADPANTLVIMSGGAPTAYVIPAFPPAVRFFRIQSNLTGVPGHENEFDRLLQRLIAGHQGPLFGLYLSSPDEEPKSQKALSAYGLRLQKERCLELKTHLERFAEHPLLFCPLSRK